MSYLSNPGDNLTAQQQTILNTYIALATTPAGQHLAKDASGNFVNTPDTTGASSAGGSNTQLQYNNGGALGGIAGMTYNGTKLNVLSSILEVSDNVDTTKKVVLALNTINTGTTITLTVPNQSGTVALLTDIPKITEVLDTNGNKILTFTTTASAVNYLDIKDNATGLAPTITAAGTDTNINIEIVPKGSGALNVSGLTKISGGASSTENLTSGGGSGRFALVGGYSGSIGGRTIFGDGTGWTYRFGTGLPNNPTDLMIMRDTGEIYGNFQPPQGHMFGGKIVTSTSAGSLTVAIKTLLGNDPSPTEPVRVRIGNTVRTLTSAKTCTYNAGVAVFNSSSAELQNQEVDYFVYLAWDGSLGVQIGISRIPYARTVSDFIAGVNSEKFCDLAYGGYLPGNTEVEVVGRLNAILSNTNQWSIPATSVIINRPIFETRRLNYKAQWSSSGTQPALGNGTISSAYQLVMNRVSMYIKQNMGSTTTYGTGNYQWTLPFDYYATANLIQLQAGSGVFYNGMSFNISPHNNYYFPGSGVSWTSSKDTITGGVCSGTNPATWNTGDYFGFGWQYDI